MSEAPVMNIQDILEYLPHRYPFLLVDRVISLTPNENITCIKNVTFNEPFFLGHFQHHPVMPGVLLIEAMAQASGILSFKSLNVKPGNDRVFYLVGVDGVRFRQPVVPGDTLHLHAEVIRVKRNMWKFHTKAQVGDDVVCEADLLCTERVLS